MTPISSLGETRHQPHLQLPCIYSMIPSLSHLVLVLSLLQLKPKLDFLCHKDLEWLQKWSSVKELLNIGLTPPNFSPLSHWKLRKISDRMQLSIETPTTKIMHSIKIHCVKSLQFLQKPWGWSATTDLHFSVWRWLFPHLFLPFASVQLSLPTRAPVPITGRKHTHTHTHIHTTRCWREKRERNKVPNII